MAQRKTVLLSDGGAVLKAYSANSQRRNHVHSALSKVYTAQSFQVTSSVVPSFLFLSFSFPFIHPSHTVTPWHLVTAATAIRHQGNFCHLCIGLRLVSVLRLASFRWWRWPKRRPLPADCCIMHRHQYYLFPPKRRPPFLLHPPPPPTSPAVSPTSFLSLRPVKGNAHVQLERSGQDGRCAWHLHVPFILRFRHNRISDQSHALKVTATEASK